MFTEVTRAHPYTRQGFSSASDMFDAPLQGSASHSAYLAMNSDSSPFVPNNNEIIKVDDFNSFLEIFSQRYVSSWTRTNIEFVYIAHQKSSNQRRLEMELFTKGDRSKFEETRQKIFTDEMHISLSICLRYTN